MKYILSLTLLVGIALQVSSSSVAPVKVPGTIEKQPARVAGLEEEILKLINEHRKKKKLGPMTMNAFMSAEAKKHSENMASRRVSFGHGGFNSRIKKVSAELNGLTGAAENVAFGSNTAKEAVDRWLTSANHRENIEGPYTLTGIGIAADKKGVLYFTQIFASN